MPTIIPTVTRPHVEGMSKFNIVYIRRIILQGRRLSRPYRYEKFRHTIPILLLEVLFPISVPAQSGNEFAELVGGFLKLRADQRTEHGGNLNIDLACDF